jgi:hypothetical protein
LINKIKRILKWVFFSVLGLGILSSELEIPPLYSFESIDFDMVLMKVCFGVFFGGFFLQWMFLDMIKTKRSYGNFNEKPLQYLVLLIRVLVVISILTIIIRLLMDNIFFEIDIKWFPKKGIL